MKGLTNLGDVKDIIEHDFASAGGDGYLVVPAQVLSAPDYGVPQNRERVYVIAIKKELDNGKFKFPEPFDNGIRLKNVLEDEVSEKYYINNENATRLISDLQESGDLDSEGCCTNEKGWIEIENERYGRLHGILEG